MRAPVDDKSARKRGRRKAHEHCYSLSLPDTLVAAALIALDRKGDLLERKVCADLLRPIVITHLLSVVRASPDAPITRSEIRKIVEGLARDDFPPPVARQVPVDRLSCSSKSGGVSCSHDQPQSKK